MKRIRSKFFVPAITAIVIATCCDPVSFAVASKNAPNDMAATFHLNEGRGPLRHVDMSPSTGEISSEILAGPTNGLDTAFIIYTRMAPGAKKKGLFTLPVEETYLVFSGKLNVQLGTDEFVAGPDTLVLVPAGVPHRAWNAGTEPVAELDIVTPAPSRDLESMMKPAQPTKIDNAAQYIRVAPPLGELKGEVGHNGLNERVLADRDTGSDPMLERLDDVPPGSGGPSTHVHPFDQVYFVTKGVMTVEYGLEHFQAPANTLVILHKGTIHSNLNNGTTVESHVTLLLPQQPKGQSAGPSVEIKSGLLPPTRPNGQGQGQRPNGQAPPNSNQPPPGPNQ